MTGEIHGQKESAPRKKILIIEDEKDMVTGLMFNLEARGYEVIAAYDAEEGYDLASEKRPDLVILDLMLPKGNGYELCRRLREDDPDLPIVMLTARSQEADIVTGLQLGADDYVTKPFSVLELLARIDAVFRRTKTGGRVADVFRFGTIEIDFRKYTASKKGDPIKLSAREFELLGYFIKKRGETVTREDLLNHVWGFNSFPNTRTVDTHIAKLRQKIEEKPDEPKYLITVHGLGYKFLG